MNLIETIVRIENMIAQKNRQDSSQTEEAGVKFKASKKIKELGMENKKEVFEFLEKKMKDTLGNGVIGRDLSYTFDVNGKTAQLIIKYMPVMASIQVKGLPKRDLILMPADKTSPLDILVKLRQVARKHDLYKSFNKA